MTCKEKQNKRAEMFNELSPILKKQGCIIGGYDFAKEKDGIAEILLTESLDKE